MITKIIDENSISVIPEDSDDLFNLRRIIKEGDTVIGDTTRVIKQDKDFLTFPLIIYLQPLSS